MKGVYYDTAVASLATITENVQAKRRKKGTMQVKIRSNNERYMSTLTKGTAMTT